MPTQLTLIELRPIQKFFLMCEVSKGFGHGEAR